MYARRLSIYGAKFACVTLLLLAQAWPQQQISNADRDLAQGMLQVIANEVRKHYYDPKLHGVNWDAKVAEQKQKIDKADSMGMALSKIAGLLDNLNDSHTFFLPPQRTNRYDYGWQYQMVGERCFVTRVRPKSDAEAKGVKPGDEILALDGYVPNRDNLWKMQYVYAVLRKQPKVELDLQDPAGKQRQVDVAARIHQGKALMDLTGSDIFDVLRRQEDDEHLVRARYAELGDQLMVLKLPEFVFSTAEADTMIKRARKYPAMIVDLRGNPGGNVEALKYLVGGMFDKEVKIADRVGRKETKPEIAKPSHSPFSGKLVVLVDARSASAAELFARIVQLEKRGVVIGDHTSGSVMESKHYLEKMGFETVIFYGASITEWNLVMADGKSLEHTGVTPDEIALPSAKDLANGSDPVMTRAAELLGVKLSADQAGKLFPYEWAPE
jgi:carboxyl-terminal processing protease